MKCTSFGRITSLHNNSLANYQSLCPKCAQHIRTQWLSSSVSYFVVRYFHLKIFNTTQLIHHVAPSDELMMQM